VGICQNIILFISGHKQEGKLCGSDINNCNEGLSCIWDGQDNGIGICKSSVGKAVKLLKIQYLV